MSSCIWYVSKYVSASANSSASQRGFLLMREFAKVGHEAVIITSDSNQLAEVPVLKAAYEVQNIDGVQIHWVRTLKYKAAKSVRRTLSWLHFEWRLLWMPEASLPKPDVVVVSSLSLLTILNGLLWRKRYKCRLVLEVRDIWPLTLTEEGGYSERNLFILGLGWIEKLGYRSADAIVGSMPNLAEHVAHQVGHGRPVHCIPMGIDLAGLTNIQPLSASYEQTYLPRGKFVVGYAGTIGTTNALDTVLECAKSMADERGVHFLVVGDGDLKAEYVKRYGSLPNITFGPKVPKPMVQSVLSRCDLLYFSVRVSEVWRYGQSLNKVIDCMLAGKPVVASYTGFPSMIDEADCGTYVPAGDEAGLRQEILRYARMPAAEREDIGKRGRAWLLNQRPYQVLAAQYLKILLPEPQPAPRDHDPQARLQPATGGPKFAATGASAACGTGRPGSPPPGLADPAQFLAYWPTWCDLRDRAGSLKNVWILNHYAQALEGPGGTRHFHLSQHLKAFGWQATIISASVEVITGRQRLKPGENSRIENFHGIPFLWVRTPQYQGNGIGRILNMLAYSLQALRPSLVRSLPRPDVVIGSSVHPFAAIAGFLLSRRFKVPFVFEVRDLWPQTLVDMTRLKEGDITARILRKLELWLYHRAARIVALLPHAWEYIAALGIPKERVAWIPNGVDLSFFPCTEAVCSNPSQTFTFMYFGSHGQANGLDIVLNAMKEVQAHPTGKRISLRLIGDGPLKPALKMQAQALGLVNVSFESPVPKTQIPSIAAQADAFVISVLDLPNLYRYGISMNKLFEYLAARRPIVIASAAINNPIEEAGAGITVPPGDTHALANAIMQVASLPPDERFRMGNAGRLYVEENHNYMRLAGRLAMVMDDALKHFSR